VLVWQSLSDRFLSINEFEAVTGRISPIAKVRFVICKVNKHANTEKVSHDASPGERREEGLSQACMLELHVYG
jgi:hypothetical protein